MSLFSGANRGVIARADRGVIDAGADRGVTDAGDDRGVIVCRS